ncbi:MAG TPA: helix-turn-helix domain-containing protein, partial [Propionibacteriaceae bacterium]|nr:helix-turn-helix domain-containing protein [Propionibacteriaceae bacterium]
MKNFQRVTSGAAGVPQSAETDASTRQRVASSILEHGPSTAAELAERLGLTPAAIRRHLDVLLAAGQVEAREQRIYGARGRGRPAKDFVLTDAGRSMFYTAYDDIAVDALDFLATTADPDAVTRFAEARMARGEKRYRKRMANAAPGTTPAQALAAALSEDGYVAATLPSAIGEQLCQ